MPKRTKKPEAKPEPADIAHDVSATLAHEAVAHDDSPIVVPHGAGRQMTINHPDGPVSFEFQTCPICGTRRASITTPDNVIKAIDACPLDGHRFEATT